MFNLHEDTVPSSLHPQSKHGRAQAAVVKDGPKAALVVELVSALHGAGAPAHRLEATVTGVAGALHIDAAVAAQPTSVIVDVGGRARLLRGEPRDIDLAGLVAIDRIAHDLVASRRSVDQARRALRRLKQAPPRFGVVSELVAWLGAGGSAAVVFGGGAGEICLAALLSALVGSMLRLGTLLPLLSALGVGLVASGASALLSGLAGTSHPLAMLSLDPQVVVLSALIVVVPGFTLTVGLTEIATRNLTSGSARLAAAGTTLLQLGVGISLAQDFARQLWPGASFVGVHGPDAIALGPVAQVLAIVVAALSFLVLFRGRVVDLPPIIAIAAVAVMGTRLGGAWLGADAAPFVGALAVGLVSNLHARVRDVPALVLLVPGIILLVPGSLGFRGVQALIGGSGDLLDGARMLLVGASLVGGILTANSILPPRRTL